MNNTKFGSDIIGTENQEKFYQGEDYISNQVNIVDNNIATQADIQMIDENAPNYEVQLKDNPKIIITNYIKKIKTYIYKVIKEFVNKKIREDLNLTEQLVDIDSKIKSDPSISVNNELFETEIAEYLSGNVSAYYQKLNIPIDHNRRLIQDLRNRNQNLNKILSLTYYEWFCYFLGEQDDEQICQSLRGLEDYSSFYDKLFYEGYSSEYIYEMEYLMKNLDAYFLLNTPRPHRSH